MMHDLSEIIKMVYHDIGFEDLTTNALIDPDIIIKAQDYHPGRWYFIGGGYS